MVPRMIGDALALAATPVSEWSDAGDLSLAPAEMDVSDAEAAAIRATVRELVACTNSGDRLRFYSLATDNYVQRDVSAHPNLGSPPASLPPAQRSAVLDVTRLRSLADGRIGAVVVLNDPHVPAPAEAFFGIFAKEDGRWRLDRIPDPYLTVIE